MPISIKKVLTGGIPVAVIGLVVVLVDRFKKWHRTPQDVVRKESGQKDIDIYGNTLACHNEKQRINKWI